MKKMSHFDRRDRVTFYICEKNRLKQPKKLYYSKCQSYNCFKKYVDLIFILALNLVVLHF